jgi:hypothetical protein
MWLKEDKFLVKLGGIFFSNVKTLVAFNDEPVFTIRRHENGQLGIDFEVYSEAGEKIASVKRNNIYSPGKALYVLDGDADSIRLTEKASNRQLVEIKRRLAAAPVELDVSLHSYLPDGRLMNITPESSNLGGVTMQNVHITGCRIGIAIRG